MDYKRIKRIDIKKWLKQGNAVVYAFILAVLVLSIIFVFKTVNSRGNNIDNQVEKNDESTEYIPDNQSYMISINKCKNFVKIYKKDERGEFNNNVVRTCRCSVNPDVACSDDSKITEKSVWRKFDDKVYGHYVSRIGNIGYIHSVPYYAQDNSKLNVSAYNKLGQKADIGSVYLNCADSKWIYENCGLNTFVKVYEDVNEEIPSELNSFETLKKGTPYDPTDDDIDPDKSKVDPNAVDTQIKYMTGVDDCTIALNEEFDKYSGVRAVDINGKDITSHIVITGDLDVTKEGVYTLIYHLSDLYGTKLAYYRYITVSTPQSSEQQTEATITNSSFSNNTTKPNVASSSESKIKTQTTANQQQKPKITDNKTSDKGKDTGKESSSGNKSSSKN